MSTQFLNVSSTAPLGYNQYFRIIFDVSGQGLLFGSSSDKLTYIYDHMQETGAFSPMTPNPVTSGDTVMTVDVRTIGTPAFSVAEGVRRLEEISGGLYSNVRSIQKLSSIGDVTSGAADRDDATNNVNQQNQQNSLFSKVGDFFAGFGDWTSFLILGVVAYAAISLSAGLPLVPSRKRG